MALTTFGNEFRHEGMSRVTRSHRGRAPKYAHEGLHKLNEGEESAWTESAADPAIELRMQLNALFAVRGLTETI